MNDSPIAMIKKRVRNNWKIIVFLWLVMATASTVYVMRLPLYYKSLSKIVRMSSGAGASGSLGALSAMMGISLGAGGESDMSAYLQDIVESRTFLEKIANKKWSTHYLHSDTSYKATLVEWWEVPFDTTETDTNFWRIETTTKRLINPKKPYIIYSPDPRTNVISLETRFEDPKLAYEVNLFILDELNKYVNEKSREKAVENTDFIQERLKESYNDLVAAENTLMQFKVRNLTIQSPRSLLEEARLTRNVQIQQEVYLQLRKQFELAQIESQKENSVIEVIDYPYFKKKPDGPWYSMIALLGVLVTFVLSVCSVIFYYPIISIIRGVEQK